MAKLVKTPQASEQNRVVFYQEKMEANLLEFLQFLEEAQTGIRIALQAGELELAEERVAKLAEEVVSRSNKIARVGQEVAWAVGRWNMEVDYKRR
jgi:hypothetical protein